MNIYHYDPMTKEYLKSTTAEADPMETKLKGEFVPLIPAYATLTAPPAFGNNQTAVFENNEWSIKSDYRQNYLKVDENLQVQEITTIGEQEGFYLVDKTTGEEIKQNPNNFKIQNDEIIQKTESEIEAENKQKEKENKIENLKNQLSILDNLAIRPLRAILSGNSTEDDNNKLIEIEEEAQSLRTQLNNLTTM